jgi:hypothetical protein
MEKQQSPVTQEELKQIFQVADENKDGLLSFREFLLFCQKVNLKDVPDDSQRVPERMKAGQAPGPSGNGKYFPPGQYVEARRPPDCGAAKMSTAAKPHVEEPRKIDFRCAIQFHEQEVRCMRLM